MAQYQIRKRDNSTHGHGEWAVVEYMGNDFFGQWVEVLQASHDRCVAYVRDNS